MPARRCSTCAFNWPHEGEFERCPRCTLRTHVSWQEQPQVTLASARRLKLHLIFEREYRKYDEGKPSACGWWRDNPVRVEMHERGVQTPEALGALDVTAEDREEIRSLRALGRQLRGEEEPPAR